MAFKAFSINKERQRGTRWILIETLQYQANSASLQIEPPLMLGDRLCHMSESGGKNTPKTTVDCRGGAFRTVDIWQEEAI